MKLHHTLEMEIATGTGLIALAIVALAIVTVSVAVIVTRWPRARQGGEAGGLEVTARVRAGHGFDDAQKGGVEPAGGGLDRFAGAARSGGHD
nr:hypothetical protein [Brevundimonas diminuta]